MTGVAILANQHHQDHKGETISYLALPRRCVLSTVLGHSSVHRCMDFVSVVSGDKCFHVFTPLGCPTSIPRDVRYPIHFFFALEDVEAVTPACVIVTNNLSFKQSPPVISVSLSPGSCTIQHFGLGFFAWWEGNWRDFFVCCSVGSGCWLLLA